MNITVRPERLTKDWLLDRVSELQVYEWYCHGIRVGKSVVKCPYRNDKSVGSFGIYKGNGAILWKDLATDESGNCITLVQKMYNITYQEAIEKIASDLGITPQSKKVSRIVIPGNPDGVEWQKKYCTIQAKTKKFTAKDRAFLGQFGITEQDWNKENAWSLKNDEVYLNRKKLRIGKDELVFGIYYETEGWKIYLPERSKDQGKWISNIPLKRITGLENIDKSHNTLIAVNLKDYIVFRKIHPYTVRIENESLGAIPDIEAKYVTENSNKVYYAGNSDKPGKEASYKITAKHKWLHLNPPDKLLPDKDFSDWRKVAGTNDPIIEHLTKKGVIIN